jgi:nicotinamidase-related amidase
MTNQIRPYDFLTSENAALVLVDHQVGLMTGVRDYSTGELKHNVVALAKAAKALNLPIVVTTTARDSMWGPTFPELVEALPGIEIIDRSSVNAFDDARVARAIEATGCKKLIFAGISLEVCAAFPAIRQWGNASTHMWPSMPRARSARPSGEPGFCACCIRASFSPTMRL